MNYYLRKEKVFLDKSGATSAGWEEKKRMDRITLTPERLWPAGKRGLLHDHLLNV